MTKVVVDGKNFEAASGPNKKQSKQVAAEKALQQLCPDLYPHRDEAAYSNTLSAGPEKVDLNIPVTSEHLLEQVTLAKVKSPLQILQEMCAKQHTTLEFDYSTSFSDSDKTELYFVKLQLMGETASHISKNKQEAKQRISQEILSKLYPNVHTYSALLRHIEEQKNKEEEQMFNGVMLKPNLQLIEKLKEELTKHEETKKKYHSYMKERDAL